MKNNYFQDIAYYLEEITGKEQTLPCPIVLLHGFMGDSLDILPLFTKSLEFNATILAIDLPGHGKSEVPENLSMESLSTIIKNLCEHLSFSSFILFGYSMGGRVALNFAKNHGKMVKGLILESASLGIKDDNEKAFRLKKDKTLFHKVLKHSKEEDRNHAYRHFLETWYQLPLFKGIKNHPYYAEFIENKISKNRVEDLQRTIECLSVGNHPYLFDAVKNISSPILYLYGEFDLKYSETGKQLANCSSIRIKEVKGCSHNCHFSQPQKLFDKISQFLKRNY